MWIVSREENVAKVVDVLQNFNAHLQKTPSFAHSEETSFLLPHSKELRVLFRKLQPEMKTLSLAACNSLKHKYICI